MGFASFARHIGALLFFFSLILPLSAAPLARTRVTLPDSGTYTLWVQSASGTVSQLPATVTGRKSDTLAGQLVPGDTLVVLDAHTGQIARHAVDAETAHLITLTVGDFRPIASSAPAAAPAAPAPPPEIPDNRLGRAMTSLLGLLVAAGVIWFLYRVLKTRGEPLIALAKKAGVQVPEPMPLDGNPDMTTIYTPPAPRVIEKIPEEAGLSPRPTAPLARRGPAISLSGVPQLVGTQGLAAGSAFAIAEGSIIIGRDGENEIVLAENTVSRRHAQLTRDRAGQVTITDEGSVNGVYINGVRSQRAVLSPGDEIKIGDNFFRYEA